MKKIQTFNEFKNHFNYDYIIKRMVHKFGYGNTISDKMKEFENSDEFKDVFDNDSYVYHFHSYLMDLSPNTEFIKTAEPISWYSKLT